MASGVQSRPCWSAKGILSHNSTTFSVMTKYKNSIKVFVADRDSKGLQDISEALNNDKQCIWTAEVNVANWDSQRAAFEKALEVFNNRLDYVFPIAGIGERRSFPNRPNSTGFEEPDLSVLEVDEIGLIYSVWLGVQHFRRQKKNQYGWKGKSKICTLIKHIARIQLMLMHSCSSGIDLWILYPHTTATLHCS